ncbi:MAG: TetR family transcriptional regulator [Rhodococcus sp. (in: high G+C Gram-positive bacteria)]|uniref:TetR/AcrR family transcriptional regulator n=1 Tax=Rhodococcus sp. TaxID=1831 RepID=UPI003BB57DCE
MTASKKSPAAERTGDTDSRTALIEGAQRLLAQRPPSAITGKQIAKESGVHYGLIYHYFESKDALFLTAMQELTADYIAYRSATVDRSIALPRLPFEGHELWWRAAANFSADGGASYTSLGWTYPVMNHELGEILKHHPEVSEFTAKSHIVREVCLNFGWMFFKETLAHGMQISEEQMAELGHFISER